MNCPRALSSWLSTLSKCSWQSFKWIFGCSRGSFSHLHTKTCKHDNSHPSSLSAVSSAAPLLSNVLHPNSHSTSAWELSQRLSQASDLQQIGKIQFRTQGLCLQICAFGTCVLVDWICTPRSQKEGWFALKEWVFSFWHSRILIYGQCLSTSCGWICLDRMNSAFGKSYCPWSPTMPF